MKQKISGKIYGLAAVILLITTACNHKWTEQERKNFETKCAKTDSVHDMVVNFKGFENSDFDSVVVREIDGTVLADSFKLFVSPSYEAGGTHRTPLVFETWIPICGSGTKTLRIGKHENGHVGTIHHDIRRLALRHGRL